MTKQAKKQAVILLVLWVLAALAVVFSGRTAYAQNITIKSFTLQAAGNFKTPQAGEKITYPENGFVSVASSDPTVRGYIIEYLWWDCIHRKSYYQAIGETGVFTPGDWNLTLYVKVPDIKVYRIDPALFCYQDSILERIHLGGKEFHVGTICDSYVGYTTTFSIQGTVKPPAGKTLTYNGKTQTGVDESPYYTIKGNTGKNAGDYTATLTLTDKKNCRWTDGTTADKQIKWTIKPRPVTLQVVLSPNSYIFDGRFKKPSVTVKAEGRTISASGYSVVFRSNRNVGRATVSVRLKGNFSGNKLAYFRINPKGTKITGVYSITNGIKVKWRRQALKMAVKNITGYQIQLAVDPRFKNISKTATVRGYNHTYKNIVGLKPGKKYYVRIRTYMTVNGQNYYSLWSKWAK